MRGLRANEAPALDGDFSAAGFTELRDQRLGYGVRSLTVWAAGRMSEIRVTFAPA